MAKNRDKTLYPEIPGYRVAHDSHVFVRIFGENNKFWSGYSKCACGAQRFNGIIGQKCQDSAVEHCPLPVKNLTDLQV